MSPKKTLYADKNMALFNPDSLVPSLQTPKHPFATRIKDATFPKEILPSNHLKRTTKGLLMLIKRAMSDSKSKDQKPSNLLSSLLKRKSGYIQKSYGVFVEERVSGSGGSVKITCRSHDGKKYAVKTHRDIRKDESKIKYTQWLNNEITVSTSLRHSYIIATCEVLREDGKVHSVMQYCPHDLYQLVEANEVDERMAARYFAQLVHAISYMHSLGVAHRDIKLENICITENKSIKLIDFGCAFVFRPSTSTGKEIRLAVSACGSEAYIAPELYSTHSYDPRKSDVWSIAIVYLAMILRSFPWSMAKCFDYGYKMFLKHRSNSRYFNRLPKSAVPIIRRMLDPNPHTRASIDDVLGDSWVKSIKLDENSVL